MSILHGLRQFYKQFFLSSRFFLRISLNKKETDPHKKSLRLKKARPKTKKQNNVGFKFGEIKETAHFLSPW